MLLADFVRLTHVLVVCFCIITPYLYSEYMLSMWLIIVPFIVLHWVMNDDTCSLTVAEKILRGVDDDESFFASLITPIYNHHKISDKCIQAMTYSILLPSLCLVVYKLKHHYDFGLMRLTYNSFMHLITTSR